MKSKDPLDPTRLHVHQAAIAASPWKPDCGIRIEVTFLYEPWWTDEGQDLLWEQANALTCLRQALERGGIVQP